MSLVFFRQYQAAANVLTLPLGISPRKLLPQGSGSTQRVKTRGFDYIPQRAGKSSQTSFLERKLGKELFLRARGGSLTLALIEPITHARGTMPPEGRTQKSRAKNFFFAPGAAHWRSRSSNRSRTRAGLCRRKGLPKRTGQRTFSSRPGRLADARAHRTGHARARDYAAGRAYPKELGKELFLRARGGSLTLALIEPVTHARGTMPPEGRYPKELGKELFLRARGGSLTLALIEPVTHARGTARQTAAQGGVHLL